MTDRIRSPLGRYAPLMADPDPHGAHRLAAQRWHGSGDVVLFGDDAHRVPLNNWNTHCDRSLN